jgi:hypothetical protein
MNQNGKLQTPDNNSDQEDFRGVASLNQDTISKMALLVFFFIIGVITTMAVVIEYPEIIRGRAEAAGIDEEKNLYCIELDITKSGQAELDSGQIVKLQFDEYPYTQVGFVTGVLKILDHGGRNNGLRAFLYLPGGLTTNLGRPIRFKPGLKADIQVLVRNMKLIQHILFESAMKKARKEKS